MISYGVTSWVNVTPTFSHAGRPAMKLSSITHCIKSSQHTSVTLPGFVTGVIRSTIEFGNVTFFFAHAATSGYFASKYDINAHLAALPFICMLSHERIVIGKSFSIRRLSPSATYQNTLRNWLKSTLYPPSVMVREMIFISSDAILAMIGSLSISPHASSTSEPISILSCSPEGLHVVN